ncbi:hypothetical protein I547_0306 [Mycobacterium kansasii 824]|nr:hypothetical protein I547_0306 [Mycobacterium kansasii 824]
MLIGLGVLTVAVRVCIAAVIRRGRTQRPAEQPPVVEPAADS